METTYMKQLLSVVEIKLKSIESLNTNVYFQSFFYEEYNTFIINLSIDKGELGYCFTYYVSTKSRKNFYKSFHNGLVKDLHSFSVQKESTHIDSSNIDDVKEIYLTLLNLNKIVRNLID